MICPLGLSVQQQHIYTLLYKKADWNTWEVEYTAGVLTLDSDNVFGLTEKMVIGILDKLQKSGYIKRIEKGFKGSPSRYLICREFIIDGQQLVTNRSVIGQQFISNDGVVPTLTDLRGQQLVTNRSVIGQQFISTISNTVKEIEKETKHMSVFDAWQSEKIHVHKGVSKSIAQQLNKLTTHQAEEVITAIKNYAKAYRDQNYYYNNVWTLDAFIKQSNGYKQWLDEGKLWVDYNSRNEIKKPAYKRETIS